MKKNKSLETFQEASTISSNTTSTNTNNATSKNSNKEKDKNEKDKKEEVKPKEEKTPAESGLVFGYLPENIKPEKLEYKLDPNTIYGGSSINLNSKNLYLGSSEKNPLLPVFLPRLGNSFKPYEYATVKIHIKNNDFNETAALDEVIMDNTEPVPIFCNKTIICFTIKYLQDNYFLQYIPNTSTFYLTNKPSYFNIINAMDINTEREVKYKDSILLRCLDNSELLLIYDSFIVTEPNKSSTFYIEKADSEDLCINFNKSNVDLKKFLPQYVTPIEAANRINANKKTIDSYVAELKKTSAGNINAIKANIILLETKRSNLITKTQLGVEQKKQEYNTNLEREKKKIDDEINKYKSQLDKEFEDFKKTLTVTKGRQWENELEKFRKDIQAKCKIN